MTEKEICRRRRESPAVEEVAGNEDLLMEIFLRLPVRSLIKFKSVSKQWSSLISEPQFASNHTLRRNPSSLVPSGLYFYNSLTKSQEIESVSLDDGRNQPSRVKVRVPSLSFLGAVSAGATMKVLQSCNGLLLCSFTSKLGNFAVKTDYCVCNPTTKKYTIIPLPCLTARESIMEFSLAFDPWESPYYSVVCVRDRITMSLYLRDGAYEIDIYSSENGIWRTCICRFNAPMHKVYCSAVYWNNVIHWLADQIDRCYSVQFDINTENLTTVAMPPVPQGSFWYKIRYFGEIQGHLHLIYICSRTAKKFRVLERDRNTLKWSVKYRVHMCHLISSFPEIVWKTIRSHGNVEYEEIEYAFSVLSIVKGEKEDDSALVLTIPGKVISYNLKHKTAKVLCELPCQVVDTSNYNCVTSYPFIESFASV